MADELRGVIAIRRCEHVVGMHRARGPHTDRFLAERGRERADLAGALQRNRLRVEHARAHHRAVQPQERLRFAGERGQRLRGLARRIPVQYVDWVRRLAGGDLGESLWTHQPVLGELARRMPVTLVLGLLALVVAVLIR